MYGEVLKSLKEMKRKTDYDKRDLVNFYDVKKGRRDTIKEGVKDQIHQSFRYVFENVSSPQLMWSNTKKIS